MGARLCLLSYHQREEMIRSGRWALEIQSSSQYGTPKCNLLFVGQRPQKLNSEAMPIKLIKKKLNFPNLGKRNWAKQANSMINPRAANASEHGFNWWRHSHSLHQWRPTMLRSQHLRISQCPWRVVTCWFICDELLPYSLGWVQKKWTMYRSCISAWTGKRNGSNVDPAPTRHEH